MIIYERDDYVERHSEFKYKIGNIDSENGWIYIKDVNDQSWENLLFTYNDGVGPSEFLWRINDKKGWKIVQDGFGYRFVCDKLEMVFWWDDLFGFTVSVKKWRRHKKVIKFLKDFCE